MMPPTVSSNPLPSTPVQKTSQPPTQNDPIARFYNDSAITGDKKKMLSDAIAK